MNLQEEIEKIVALGFEVTVKCNRTVPDDRMASKGFSYVVRNYTIFVGKVDEEPSIASGSFNEPDRAIEEVIRRLPEIE